jgi:hypothetical protein
MAKDPDNLAGSFETENTGGLLSGFLAEEEPFDRRSLWRLGSWGAASVGAVIVAVLANQSAIGWRREQVASTDLVRQSQQIQSVAKESQNETRRLASAIDTLNGDRDRLYSRLTVLEQGLDSVTGSIARQNSAAAPPPAAPVVSAPAEPQAAVQNPAPPPAVAPPATTAAVAPATTAAAPAEKPRAVAAVAEPAPVTVAPAEPVSSNTPTATPPTPAVPLMASKSMMAPPDAAAAKLIEPEAPASAITAAPMPEVVAAVQPADNAEQDATPAAAPKLAVQRTEFAVDVGTANSIGGLRALWRGLLKSNTALAALRPIIVVKEGRNGLGMQLRLVAGPLGDAAAAARICATLTEGQKTCETTVFDGQRLAMQTDEAPASIKPDPALAKLAAHKRSVAKRPTPPEPKPEVSTFSSLFGKR